MRKEEYIKQLLDKYLDGETPAAEEKALRGYFANGDNNIPEEWLPYRALFAYIAEEQATRAQDTGKTDSSRNGRSKAKTGHRHGWIYTAITAAAAILIAAVMIMLPRQNDNYAVIDGKVYTNKKVVEEEALKALDMVSADEDDSFGALEMMRH